MICFHLAARCYSFSSSQVGALWGENSCFVLVQDTYRIHVVWYIYHYLPTFTVTKIKQMQVTIPVLMANHCLKEIAHQKGCQCWTWSNEGCSNQRFFFQLPFLLCQNCYELMSCISIPQVCRRFKKSDQKPWFCRGGYTDPSNVDSKPLYVRITS